MFGDFGGLYGKRMKYELGDQSYRTKRALQDQMRPYKDRLSDGWRATKEYQRRQLWGIKSAMIPNFRQMKNLSRWVKSSFQDAKRLAYGRSLYYQLGMQQANPYGAMFGGFGGFGGMNPLAMFGGLPTLSAPLTTATTGDATTAAPVASLFPNVSELYEKSAKGGREYVDAFLKSGHAQPYSAVNAPAIDIPKL